MAKGCDIPEFGLLHGLKVLGCGSVVAEPHAECLMAEHGADVIHAENVLSPDMNRGFTPVYSTENRNKRNLAINIPEAKELFTRLLQWADVWLEGSKPGTYDKWGFSDEEVQAINPKLVIVHVSGYGQTGDPEFVKKAGMDVAGQAYSGLMSINGMPDPQPPMLLKPGMCDYLTALYATWSALAGVYHARETGKGDVIDVAQYEPLLRIQGYTLSMYLNMGIQTQRVGNAEASFAGIDSFKCSDGTYVVVQVNGPRQEKMAAVLLDLPADHPAHVGGTLRKGSEEGNSFDAALKAFCESRTADEVLAVMDENKIPCSIVNDYARVVKEPHMLAREDFIEWFDDNSGTTVKGVGLMPKVKHNPPKIWRGAPKLGMDNDDILEELGYSADEIQAFYDRKAIGKQA